MITRQIAILLGLLGLAAAANARAADPPKPVKVFILAGQSNMEGQAVVDLDGKDYNDGKGTLAALLKDPAKAALVKHLKTETGAWAVRDDVWVRYQREKGPLLAGPLTVGFSVYGDKHHFGPELQFGHVVGDHFTNQVLLIKTAWGGKSLYKDFRPPSSGGDVGPYYTKMLEHIGKSLDNLKADFPGYDGRGYELAGFVWYHGWNDGVDPKKAVPEYEENLVNFIKDVRKDLKAPNLPFVIGELTGPWVEAPGEWATLRKGQAAAAARPEFKGTVLFVETHDFVRPAKESPNPGHGHHEFGNAETYFLVGDALGKGMVNLLSLEAKDQPKQAKPKQRPNVLIILADDMGFSDAGCYGGEIETPNLNALAKNGLRFAQFYNTARCWPSRAAILTGYYAQQVRRDTLPGIESGAQGTRPPWARLLPEMLKPLDYRSYHSGKWHVDGKPLQNGFDHSYSLDDHDRHFTPRRHTEDDKALEPVDAKSAYYSSTAIADHAIKCLKEHAEKYPNQPFLEYLAFTAPHFPLQASAEDIAPYRKRYLTGWDTLRDDRWQRMKEMKIGGSALAPIERELGPPYDFPDAIKKLGPNELNRPLPWKDLNAEQREFQATKMAIHAAMVDRMDREIGRVLAQLRAMDVLENTLVFFLSDNGASAEIMVRGDGHDPHAECGTGATFLSIGPGWSSLANTPFRRHKTWVHEGGISTPLIVQWPKGITARGEVRHTPGHIIDLVPTILEAAGGKRLEKWVGQPVPPAPGKSLIPLFAKDGTVAHDCLWWLHEDNRALRVGDWKIVAAGKDIPWELYDVSSDRSESKNQAKDKPEKVRELAAIWTKRLEEFTALARKDLLPDSKINPNK